MSHLEEESRKLSLSSSIEPKSILDTMESSSAGYSIPDEYQGISISHQPLDPAEYFSNSPLDDVIWQGLKGYETYLYGLVNGPPSTPIPSPLTYFTQNTNLPTGTIRDFQYRTQYDPQIPQPMETMPSPSTYQFNESFPFPNQVSADITFKLGEKLDSGAPIPVHSVRYDQLEKVSDLRLPCLGRSLTY
jgi:hypothetical protein